MTKQQAAEQAEKPEVTPEFPAGKQQNMSEIMEVLRPAVQADAARFMNRQHAYNIFSYWAMSGSKLADHLEPIFWLQLGSKLNPLDEIVITEEQGAWRARLLVRSIGPDGADVIVLDENPIGGTAPLGAKYPLKDGPRVEYRGRHLRWSVFSGDKELVSHLPTEEMAVSWLQNSNVTGPTA